LQAGQFIVEGTPGCAEAPLSGYSPGRGDYNGCEKGGARNANYLSDLLLLMGMIAVLAWSFSRFEVDGWLRILSPVTGFSASL
jgi:hypothetical protein